MDVTLSPNTIVRWLARTVAVLFVLNFSPFFVLPWVPVEWRDVLVRAVLNKFMLDFEASVGTWYAVTSLATCAMLLLLVGARERRAGSNWSRYWTALGVIFVLLSVEECAGFHEAIGEEMMAVQETRGFLHFAWVLPALVIVPLIGLAFVPFLIHLDARTRWGFVLAGAIYVTGAVGMELIGGEVLEQMGRGSLLWFAATALEETLEMVGVVIFIHFIAGYATKRPEGVSLRLAAAKNS